MASLSKISEGWQAGYRLRVSTGGKRHSVWLGAIRDREAMAIKIHVEAVVDAQRMKTPLPAETQRWLRELSPELRVRLRGVLGSTKSVDEAVEEYLEQLAASEKDSTVRAHADSLEQFASYFGSQNMRSLNGESIDEWLRQRNVSESTIGKHAKHLRTWLKWCKAQDYCDRELAIATPATIGVGEKEFIPLVQFKRVIEYFADDPEMQCILALSRWAGLRVASELVTLRRSWLDIESQRIKIDDSKRTRRRSRGPPRVRELPLFAGMLPFVEPMLKLPGSREDYLLPTIGGMDRDRAGSLLRSRVYRALDALGMVRWPKVFHSPRASRETELMEVVGAKAASEWIGNSAAVAVRNYELIRGETWSKAIDA